MLTPPNSFHQEGEFAATFIVKVRGFGNPVYHLPGMAQRLERELKLVFGNNVSVSAKASRRRKKR